MQLWKVIGFTNIIFAFKESILNIPGCLKQEEKGAIHEMTEYSIIQAFFTKDAMKDAVPVLF